MKCPKCRTETRGAERLESNLVADRCHQCQGHWINSFQYWRWRDSLRDPLPPGAPEGAEPITVSESERAMLCPECGHFLSRFRVGHSIPFSLDRCGECGGVWFDSHEWAVLREHGLHQDVHLMFTAAWQRELRREESRSFYEELYRRRFGEADYAELRRVRGWLESQPERSAMIRYLADPDPYSS